MPDSTPTRQQAFERLTPRMALQLAAPHTWPAAIMPCLIAVSLACASNAYVSVSVSLALLVICILMQSAVNTLNDYYDYVKGTDSPDDNVDVSDATLVYNDVDPVSALKLAIGMLVAAFALGAYVVVYAGWIPLALGALGAIFVVLYSAGKTPISYLPIGEIVSGTVMGGIIPLACYQALTGRLDLVVLLWALPTIIGVALIMMTNNTCDIEKDLEAGRKTLPCLLGREKTRGIYRAAIAIWIAVIVVNCAAFFSKGLLVAPFLLLAVYPLLKAIFANPLIPASRQAAMGQICNLNIALGAFYSAAIMTNNIAFFVI